MSKISWLNYSSTTFIYESVFIISLILYLVNFYNRIGLYLLIVTSSVTVIFFLYKKFTKRIIILAFILFAFTLMFTLIIYTYEYIGYSSIPEYAIIPVIALLSGYLISRNDLDNKKVYSIIFLIMIFMTLYILMSYIKTINYFGSLENASKYFDSRSIASMWNMNHEIKATGMTVRLLFGLALIPTIFIPIKTKKRKMFLLTKIITIICFVISIFLSLSMGSRTGILLVIMSFLFFVFTIRRNVIEIFLRTLGITFFFFFLMILYNINIFNIKTWWMNTSAYTRFQEIGIESSRTDTWLVVLKNFFKYPLGGRKIDITINYAHNLWLDVIYDAGWIVGILLIVYSVLILVYLIQLVYLNCPVYLKSLILLMFLGFFIFFMTEPTLSGGQKDFFILFCFFNGVLIALIERYSKENVSMKLGKHQIGSSYYI